MVYGALALVALPSSHADAAPTPKPDARLASITCAANASAPIVFYGQLPQLHYMDEQPSYVQIFPTTDISEFFFQSMSDRLHGVEPTAPAGGGIDFQRHRLDMTISAIGMQSTASRAMLARKGSWACRGFSPGKYTFLATIHELAKTQSSGGQDTIVTQYYRADADVADTTKPTLLVPVTPFRLIGQTPQ